jgi:hypothetical protein
VTICNADNPQPSAPAVDVKAVLLDTNSNGQFDRLDLTFPDTVSIKQNLPSINDLIQKLTFTTSSGTVVTLVPVAIVRADSVTLHVILRESSSGTGQDDYQSGQLTVTDAPVTVQGNPIAVVALSDAAGPIVRKAVLHAAASPGLQDTLLAYFSEPVNCQDLRNGSPASDFYYFDNRVSNTDILNGATFLGSCSNQYISEISILLRVGAPAIAPFEDSISFVGRSPAISDRWGNHPPADAKKAAIVLATKGPPIELTIAPNPVVAGTPINAKVRQAYAAVVNGEVYGTVIGLYSIIPLKPVRVGSVTAYGKADIYDATGNLVQSALPVIKTDRTGVYGVYWNLRNRNQRLVGIGAYLVAVTTTDINNLKSTKRVKVGVQR